MKLIDATAEGFHTLCGRGDTRLGISDVAKPNRNQKQDCDARPRP